MVLGAEDEFEGNELDVDSSFEEGNAGEILELEEYEQRERLGDTDFSCSQEGFADAEREPVG